MFSLVLLFLYLGIILIWSRILPQVAAAPPLKTCLLLLVKDQAELLEGLWRELCFWFYFRGHPWAILIIDAGSQDETPLILQKLATRNRDLNLILEPPGSEVDLARLAGEYGFGERDILLDLRRERDGRTLRRRLRQALRSSLDWKQKSQREGYSAL